MTQAIETAFLGSFDRPSLVAKVVSPSVLGPSGLGFTSLFAGLWLLNAQPLSTAPQAPTQTPTIAALEAAAPVPSASAEVSAKVPFNAHGALLLALRAHAAHQTVALSADQPLTPILGPLRPSADSGARPAPAQEQADATPTQTTAPQLSMNAPLPPRRPGDLTPAPKLPPVAARIPAGRQPRTTVVAEAPADNRSFVERLFGAVAPQQPQASNAKGLPRQTVAYAATPDTGGLLGSLQSKVTAAPAPAVASGADGHTALYDISAHVVILPNGRRLEAHSGLGDRLDDPNYVHERMRGATPPHLYELTQREALFHGVPALRLNPIGPGHIYGRGGLLAHTFMLGPRGDSNGCVSFRDYYAFFHAYQSGEVRRLMVVAHAN